MVHPGLGKLQEVILFVVDVSLPVPGNTALVCICVIPVLATMAMGMLSARQAFSHPLCHCSLCSAEQPLMGHRTFAGGTFFISCCSASLKFLISPWARGIVQSGLRVLPGILFWCLLVL